MSEIRAGMIAIWKPSVKVPELEPGTYKVLIKSNNHGRVCCELDGKIYVDYSSSFSSLEHYTENEEVESLTGVCYKQWGHYKVLHRGPGYTVKELTILPGKSLSDQRHFRRDEHWFVVSGALKITLQRDGETAKTYSLYGEDGFPRSIDIRKKEWHRPFNRGKENVVVIEVWLGDSSEDDIERRNV